MKQLRHATLIKSSYTSDYICIDPMPYDLHLLFLLLTAENSNNQSLIQFCKSSTSCWTTAQIFMHKKGTSIELFDVYDLANMQDLCLPQSPKFVFSSSNFVELLTSWSNLYKAKPEKILLVLDEQNYAHLVTDLNQIIKKTFFGSIQKSVAQFFGSK